MEIPQKTAPPAGFIWSVVYGGLGGVTLPVCMHIHDNSDATQHSLTDSYWKLAVNE